VTPWLVVPTLGSRDASLLPLLEGAGMPAVVVCTGPASPSRYRASAWDRHALHAGGGEMNIQRWWNLGISYTVERGADAVVVVNDDVAAAPGALLELAAHIEAGEPHAPMLVWPDVPEHAAGRVTGMTGWCWAIDPQRIRPDEAFKWWYGDNDLELRARAMRPDSAVRAVEGLDVKHLRTDYAYERPVQHLIDHDVRLFRARYPDLMGGYQ
jgi:hypothetical protein